MTLPALNRCQKCGAGRHIYLLTDAEDGSGKVCIDQKLCAATIADRQSGAGQWATRSRLSRDIINTPPR